jgi:hypothetical protein
MSQKMLNSNEVYAWLYESRRERVPQVVKAQVVDTCEAHCFLEAFLRIQQPFAGFAVTRKYRVLRCLAGET